MTRIVTIGEVALELTTPERAREAVNENAPEIDWAPGGRRPVAGLNVAYLAVRLDAG